MRRFWTVEWTQEWFLTVPPFPEALMVADFWNLHRQLQTVASILAGAEQPTVQVDAGVVAAARTRLRCGLHLGVAGAAGVGGALTASREQENQVGKAAEEAAEDHFCTVGCGTHRTFRRCESHKAWSWTGVTQRWCNWVNWAVMESPETQLTTVVEAWWVRRWIPQIFFTKWLKLHILPNCIFKLISVI